MRYPNVHFKLLFRSNKKNNFTVHNDIKLQTKWQLKCTLSAPHFDYFGTPMTKNPSRRPKPENKIHVSLKVGSDQTL